MAARAALLKTWIIPEARSSSILLSSLSSLALSS